MRPGAKTGNDLEISHQPVKHKGCIARRAVVRCDVHSVWKSEIQKFELMSSVPKKLSIV